MRRKLALALGLGLTGWLASSALGQFGSPPAGTTPPPFGGSGPRIPAAPTAPMMPPSYVPPVDGLRPATPMAPSNGFQPVGARPIVPVEIPLALGPNHPLLVKPEDGAYFICVKSYSRPHDPDPTDIGPTARELAEALANDIIQVNRSRAFLYEMITEEKKAHAEAQAKARQRAAEFSAAIEKYKQQSALQGADFLGTDSKIKYQTFKYRDQVAVLIGGFKTEDDAVKGLAIVKKWKPPEDKRLMDIASISTLQKNGKSEIERKCINPYASAMIVPNPTIPKLNAGQPVPLDPFIIKLNENRPYNLLRATKPFTLTVKSFSSPVHFVSKDEDSSLMRRRANDADVLRASADQAEALAKALREMKDRYGNPMNLEAFVLHCRAASIVTVGQFDSPNDPELLEKQRILSNLRFNVSKDDKGMQITGTGEKLFGDAIQAVPIPRH